MPLKLKCECCGFEREFENGEEAFEAGWDAPPHFTQVVTCDLCPASGLVCGVGHHKAHQYWKQHGRPKEFTVIHCCLDSEWDLLEAARSETSEEK